MTGRPTYTQPVTLVVLVVGILAVIGLDQWTKWLVLSAPETFNAMGCLNGEWCGHVELPGPMDLSMVWNRGVSFGTFQAEGLARWGLFALSGVIAAVFAVWLARADHWLTRVSLALVIAGAIGNMIDRARFGAVVDFINFREIHFYWVFNIADSAITVGAILLFLDQLLVSPRKQADDRPSSPSD